MTRPDDMDIKQLLIVINKGRNKKIITIVRRGLHQPGDT